MESIKNKIGILVLILCIVMIAAVVWYCLFGTNGGSDKIMEGTLVMAPSVQEEVMVL